ncbi:hypothetical protein BVRB_8g195380 [Beta vulgaris subsp. vulgaris]|nr:hypothetical protein BVRB_8g195380 [Beta vulgaris subsp. vulgaris]
MAILKTNFHAYDMEDDSIINGRCSYSISARVIEGDDDDDDAPYDYAPAA